MSESDNTSIDEIKALADVVIGKLRKMSRDERNEFIGHVGEEYCLKCGYEMEGSFTCWICHESYPDT